jgi:AAA domain
MAPPRAPHDPPRRSATLSPVAQRRLQRFKAFAVAHPILQHADTALMRALHEPAGFTHVLVYGPSGVGKSTMIRQIVTRLNAADRGTPPGGKAPMPLLLLEARPPDTPAFNRTDYYRTALKGLGEPFFERRVLVDIEAEPTWEKKGRKAARFQDSAELRQALEEALRRHGVRAVIIDEAQHLMKVGSGAKLLDQLDWIKSMTNVTEVLHILLGTYDLLAFRNLSGQASRRSLDIHFARYQVQQEQDRHDFQGVLLALLKQVPLTVDVETLMCHWPYFYERSIGCVGILKDWLVRTVATILYDGSGTLTLARLHEHVLSEAQCERMAIEATEGEQALCSTEQHREHLWSLLQLGLVSAPTVPPVPAPLPPEAASAALDHAPLPAPELDGTLPGETPVSSTRRKRTTKPPVQAISESSEASPATPAPTKPRPRKKTRVPVDAAPELSTVQAPMGETHGPPLPSAPAKRPRRVGERKPVRDPVGAALRTR